MSVAGVSGDTNVLRAGPASPARAVVFFEGDQITDEDTREILGLERCSPEGHLKSMAAHFPDALVLLVMPTTVVSAGQACFGNFICASTATGEPLGFKPQEYRAAAHIRAILAASGFNVAASVELVGFSKGAVVLNQLLTEMAWHEEALANSGGAGPGVAAAGAGASTGAASGSSVPSSAGGVCMPAAARAVATGAAPRTAAPADARLLDSIRTVHFLDAGLNSRGVHLTDAGVVHWLGRRHQRLPLDLQLHGTPRQWADRKRPWITAEKTRFIELLKTAECRISPREVAYFSGQPGTLKQHFDIIAAMQPRAEAAN
ncbi:hypothetical protein CHLRE_03g181600v5 [Chlamydomonas reinhardtii]|uniref:Uncharacterized protein n=1 Tax=Chlamydomonas reinhardtii TaxID=3055 RepID=A0A2K3DXS7_CHLRE|nr:uncharacterized protein CHLRE_03g181600v5 [Chlamydomonas reinhardtii]PNW85336.1 hypothetical protein CHLRE_03g181600v5 [Chlamydomonas reinhardtii]